MLLTRETNSITMTGYYYEVLFQLVSQLASMFPDILAMAKFYLLFQNCETC